MTTITINTELELRFKASLKKFKNISDVFNQKNKITGV